MLFSPTCLMSSKRTKDVFCINVIKLDLPGINEETWRKGRVFVLNKFMLIYVLLSKLKVLSTCMIEIKSHEFRWMNGEERWWASCRCLL